MNDIPMNDIVCGDPFMGSGTTAAVCKELGRGYIGIDLNPRYVEIARKRVDGMAMNEDYQMSRGTIMNRREA